MIKKLTHLLMVTLLLFAFTACEQEGPAERAGENIDEAVEDAGEALEDAGDAIEEGAEKAVD